MMEAAAAYYEATGKDRLLKVMERMADHIASRFGTDKQPGIPGHQEIEIGLMKLYHATGKDKYRELAQYFLDERGSDPAFFKKEKGAWEHFWHQSGGHEVQSELCTCAGTEDGRGTQRKGGVYVHGHGRCRGHDRGAGAD